MDPKGTILRVAYGLLIPAPVVFSIRSAFQMAGSDIPGVFLAIVGILSGAGMIAAIVATWKTNEQWKAIVAVAVALLGHYVVNRYVDADLGGAMVYLGTGFIAGLRIRWAQYTGMIAGVGALLRGEVPVPVSHSILIVGALGTAVALGLHVVRPKPTP